MKKSPRVTDWLFGIVLLLGASCLAAQQYDLVLSGGRVMDPESGLDAVRNIGIKGNSIEALSVNPLQGRETIEVKGLVVAPGFIDLHAHGQTPENYRLRAFDGVTTALEMEIGVGRVAEWYAAREGRAAINFGASSGHAPACMAVMHDNGTLLPIDEAATRRPTPRESRDIFNQVRAGLDQGALGIGFGLEYVPMVSRADVLKLFHLAAQRGATCFVHLRHKGMAEPGVLAGLQEVIADSAASGASLHVVHITSSGRGLTEPALRMLEDAQKRGLNVTTEFYPYPAAMTDLKSAVFNPGWQERMGVTYGDLLWTKTGERLTRDTFERYRKQGGMTVIFGIPEPMILRAIASPLTVVASDGEIENGRGHPRGAGTYARMLAKYVREESAIPLMECLRKMTLGPAQRLETYAPAFRRKGRVAVGSDADLVVFDPARVTDRATFEQPALPSEGFEDVVVQGQVLIRSGKFNEAIFPGRGIRRKQA